MTPEFSPQHPLPVVWQTPPGAPTDFEWEWITEVLLAGIPHDRIMDYGALSTVRDRALIVYSCNQPDVGAPFRDYLDRFHGRGFRFHLLHLSNEEPGHDCSYYTKAGHVFRNYFDPAITAPNVIFLPLGFQSGFLNRTGSVAGPGERTIEAAFIGQPKNDRIELILELSKLRAPFLHTTGAWACDTALPSGEVAAIYGRTRYVPCPKGWVHEDSFRICEALEWGAVPVLRDYGSGDVLRRTMPGHPFPILKDWGELPGLIDSTDYPALHTRCAEWYRLFRKGLAECFGAAIR